MAKVASNAVTCPMSPSEIKLNCDWLRRELPLDPEISQVTMAGFSTHRLLVRAQQAALSRDASMSAISRPLFRRWRSS